MPDMEMGPNSCTSFRLEVDTGYTVDYHVRAYYCDPVGGVLLDSYTDAACTNFDDTIPLRGM